MKQKTLKTSCSFQGKGLHSGKYAYVRVCPASCGSGIVFVRTDLDGAIIPALAENVSSTARSTTISCGNASVGTVEHIMSAFAGLGIDNAVVEIDGKEMPILDGSAREYVGSFLEAGIVEQDEERRLIEIKEEIVVSNPKIGGYVRIVPADEPSIELTIDFDSKVLGVQTVTWDLSTDYASQIAPCRTFCFLHEIQLLATLGLVKGGDVENAIIVVEKPVSDRSLKKLARRFGQPELTVTSEGYLSNLTLRYPDECGRHKLLDLMGDLRLSGGILKAKVIAYKPGHTMNTNAAKEIRKQLFR